MWKVVRRALAVVLCRKPLLWVGMVGSRQPGLVEVQVPQDMMVGNP